MIHRFLLISLVTFLLPPVHLTPIEKFVFDSTQLSGELNWDKEAYGESSELPAGWKEQSFSQKNGDVWRVHFVCDIASANPDNWLRLPLIRREEANRLSIKLEYTIRECKKYPGEIRSCKETFQLLYAEVSDGDMANSANNMSFTETSYKYLKTIAPNSDLNKKQVDGMATAAVAATAAAATGGESAPTTSSSSHHSSSNIFRAEVELPLRSASTSGIYLVFRDQGACVSLLSVRVSYTLCSAQVNKLAIYPRTPTGTNLTDLVQRTGSCVLNAEAKSTPFAYCQTNGNWFFVSGSDETTANSGGNMCFCRPGFFYHALNAQCLACPQGKYKPDLSNRVECTKCPDNSYTPNPMSSDLVGATSCKCLDNYYRIDSSNLSSPCTAYPPEPKNLTVFYLDQASVHLRWNPLDTAKHDPASIKYKLDCFKCSGGSSRNASSSSICSDKSPCEPYISIELAVANQVTLRYLDASTQYMLELYAYHARHSLARAKPVDLMVRTSEASLPAERLIRNLTACQFTEMNQIIVMWLPNEDVAVVADDAVLSYEIRYWPTGHFGKASAMSVPAPASNFTFRAGASAIPGLLVHTLYVFQLRAQSRHYGWTDLTAPVESIKIDAEHNKDVYSLLFLRPSTWPVTSSSSSTLFSTKEYIYNQLLFSSPSAMNPSSKKPISGLFAATSSSFNSNNLTFYAVAGLLTMLTILILVLIMLTVLSRSGRLPQHLFADFLLKNDGGKKNKSNKIERRKQPVNLNSNTSTSSSSATTALALAQYNQLGICSSSSTAGTTSTTSGGSSPIWPGSNSSGGVLGAGPKSYIDPHTYEDPTKIVSLFARELHPQHIIIEKVIGGGEFGDVCRGRLKNLYSENNSSEIVVAIKTLKDGASEQNRCDFLTEASIMSQFSNENVIRLEGVVTQSQPLMIVTEFMENGSLDDYLSRNKAKLKTMQMVKMLRDVSNGMMYLADMKYIHRDLAARNILITRQLVCKVADFGLSREIVDTDTCEYTTKGGKIPIRWTAPEACTYRKYSWASDVWSFGVLAWEVLSGGERPYWQWENKDVVRAVQEALYRLPPPEHCPECIYKLMRHCWQEDRTRRPTFTDIHSLLDELLNQPPIACEQLLNEPAHCKELLPISPRHPNKVQLTRTRSFLARLGFEHHAEYFECAGLANMSNLFHLDANELFYVVGVQSHFEQKKILDELKKVYDAYMSHQYCSGGGHYPNPYHHTLSSGAGSQQNSYISNQQQQILTLLRANSSIMTNKSSIVMNTSANNTASAGVKGDLLTFSSGSSGGVVAGTKNGYLV